MGEQGTKLKNSIFHIQGIIKVELCSEEGREASGLHFISNLYSGMTRDRHKKKNVVCEFGVQGQATN